MENSPGQWTDDHHQDNNELFFNQLDQIMSSLDDHQQILAAEIKEFQQQDHDLIPLSLEDYPAAFSIGSDQDHIASQVDMVISSSSEFSYGKQLPAETSSLNYLSFGKSDNFQLDDPTRTVLNMEYSSLGFVEGMINDDNNKNNNILGFHGPADHQKRAMSSRTPSGAQEHVIAERNRREKINQHFIALSSIIPEVKKVDKASLLAGAIDYVKQLEEKVKNLEQKVMERTTHTAILVHNSTHDDDHDHHPSKSNSDDEDGSFCGSNIKKGKSSIDDEILPKVEVCLNGNTILVRILQCQKIRKGLLVKLLSQLEKLNLSVLSTSLIPFAASSLNITVTALIEEGFSMTMKDLVKEIDLALIH